MCYAQRPHSAQTEEARAFKQKGLPQNEIALSWGDYSTFIFYYYLFLFY